MRRSSLDTSGLADDAAFEKGSAWGDPCNTAEQVRRDGPQLDGERGFIAGFHEGNRATFAALYEDHFTTVERAVGRILQGADKETVIHEVFYQLMTNADVRLRFQGGSLQAWLTTLAKNRAIDFQRRRQLECPVGTDLERFGAPASTQSFEPETLARLLLQRFRATALPTKWRRVFDARFIRQLDQREAAEELGMSRTTLAYQEYRVRRLLRSFALGSRLLAEEA